MTGLEIRPRTNDDLPTLAGVLVRVHALDGYPVEGVDDPIGWLTPARAFGAWTASYDGKPIGQAAITHAAPDDDAARIWRKVTGGDVSRLAIPARLFVDPDHRQRGAGGALMRAVVEHAHGHGLVVAFDVMLKDQAAIRLYEAAGCVRIGTLDHQHSDGRSEPAAVYAIPDIG